MARPATPLGRLCPIGGMLTIGAFSAVLLGSAPRSVVAQMANGCDTPSDPSVAIEAHVGQPVTIALAANATTGYLWLLAQPPDPAVLQVQQAEYRAAAPAGSASGAPIVGRGGISCWTFLAVGPGETTAGFEYRRPFALDQPPGDSAGFDVVVDPSP